LAHGPNNPAHLNAVYHRRRGDCKPGKSILINALTLCTTITPVRRLSIRTRPDSSLLWSMPDTP
jgi:hypothetical protein